MSNKKIHSPWVATALICAAFPALGQSSPDDKAKQTIEATCNTCHPLSARIGNGYDAKGWHTVMRMMLNQGAPVPKDQIEPITDYLIKTYPEKDKPAAKVIPGPVKTSMKEWPAPTPGSRPHDPLATSDGSTRRPARSRNIP
jgi:virginiamycin B lyase